ncbi:MAG: hypothetical protein CUR33_06235 [Pseudomonas sp.]|nr:MAG: hypothetical protein CUR33_06235 [Pseudomonas sp.] [Pseudomonas sp. FEMGT703P]
MAWVGKYLAVDLLRVGPAALKTGSECSCTTVHSASSPVFALQVSSSLDLEKLKAKKAPHCGAFCLQRVDLADQRRRPPSSSRILPV